MKFQNSLRIYSCDSLTISKDRLMGRALHQAESGDILVSNDLEMISKDCQKLTSV